MEWIIYTLCVVGFLIIIALSHFVRSYRKRLSKNIGRENIREDIEMGQERVDQPYAEIYDEIDENLVGLDNNNPLVIPELWNTRAITNDVWTVKINTDQEDNSNYLDPVFAIDETESQSSLKESSSSHSSNVHLVSPDDTGYLNPYQPLQREQQMSDGYEVAIRVHKNSESSSGSAVSEDGSSAYKYSHVYQKLQQDRRTNTHMYEKAIMNEKEMNHSEKNQTESRRNKDSADKKIIDLSDLLFDTEIDRTNIEHVSFDGQTIEDDDREKTDNFTNADDGDSNNILGHTDKHIQQYHTRMLHDENCIEQVPHEDISNEYLDMQNPTQKDDI